MALAPPSPPTFLVGGALTAAVLNTNIRDGLTFLANPPIAVLFQAVAQSVGNNAWTALTFDSTNFDTYSGHSNTTNNSRWTCPQAGYYELAGAAAFVANGTGVRGCGYAINGTQASIANNVTTNAGAGAVTCTPMASTIQFLNLNDYVQLLGYQVSGGALNTSVGTFESHFMIKFVHA
jgi:hypothetical protein